ncbi:uncharacterized protein LOC117176915 [Belonocnema kinseyi]|uniref:uncharacterized protein LOC117176915 n=1 Tax=Belonocnema kinseyi TaxID=2817044 RepID=UPI00143CF3BA|nr:uncharacterized protein LOC117176915 [Belonocnema kinseyi]
MAIMQSCCCWRTVRRGSFACAIYSAIYYLILIGILGETVYKESPYLSGKRPLPESSSLLEVTLSELSIMVSITLMINSGLGIFACWLLVYGLLTDRRLLLLPWILITFVNSLVDVMHFLYTAIWTRPPFDPTVAMTLMLGFFLLCLNIYSLLCVFSQFQEYNDGRGRATDDSEYRVPAIRYTAQATTTATSCLSSRRMTANNDTKGTATATPTQSPTTAQQSSINSPTHGRQTRKHVNFPDVPSVLQVERPDNQTVNPLATRCTLETEVGGTRLDPSNHNSTVPGILVPVLIINPPLEKK